MAVVPYRVSNRSDKPVDYVLSILRGAVAGYAGGQKVKQERDSMNREFQLKQEQIDITNKQVDQQLKMHIDDLEERKAALASSQLHDVTMLKIKKEIDEAISKKEMEAKTIQFFAEYQQRERIGIQNMKMQALGLAADTVMSEKKLAETASGRIEETRYRTQMIELERQRVSGDIAGRAQEAEWRHEDRVAALNLRIQEAGDKRESKAVDALGTIPKKYDDLVDNLRKMGVQGISSTDIENLSGDDLKLMALVNEAVANKDKYKKASDDAKKNVSNLTKLSGFTLAKKGKNIDVYVYKEDLMNEDGDFKTVKDKWMTYDEYVARLPESSKKDWEVTATKAPTLPVDKSQIISTIPTSALDGIKRQAEEIERYKKSVYRIYAPELLESEPLPVLIPRTNGTTEQPTRKAPLPDSWNEFGMLIESKTDQEVVNILSTRTGEIMRKYGVSQQVLKAIRDKARRR